MTMQNSGAYLKSVREEKGYSIAEVSKNTKISPAVLRALEEGLLDNIDPVYLKGFLKMYCRFLRVDWQEFSKEYPVTTAAKYAHPSLPRGASPMTPDAKESASPWKGIKNSLVSFILEKKKIILISLWLAVGALFMALIFRGCRPSAARTQKAVVTLSPKKPSKITTPAQSAPPLTPPKIAAQAEEKKIPPVSPAQTPASKESKPKEITLVIRAKEQSFIKVKVDGRTIYQGLLRKGNAESWSAKDKIELYVGNAAAVALEVDGKVFSSLGRKGQPLKNILINREGLKINP